MGVSGTGNAWYTVNFANPTGVTAGTNYAIVLKAGSGGPFRAVSSSSAASYANRAWFTTSNSGANWAASIINSGTSTSPADPAFRAYVGNYSPRSSTACATSSTSRT
jgi:hypothetical protein